MPTDSELKEAAERLRSIVPDERMWDEPAAQWSDIDKDLWVCAFGFVRHILAQRADDGDAVTFEEIESRLSDPDIFTVTQVRGVVMVFVESPFAIKTRGDLFRLLSALNVSTGGGAGLTRSKGD